MPVVLSFVAQPDREMPGAYARPPLTLKAPAMGFVNDAVDAGGVVRHFRALVPGPQGTQLPSFGLALLSATPQGLAPLAAGPDGAFSTTGLFWRLRFLSPRPPEPAPLTVTSGAWEQINYIGPSKAFVTIASNAVAAAAEVDVGFERRPLPL